MKVTRDKAEFVPVVITLESQWEVDLIGDLLALCGLNGLERSNEMFSAIQEHTTDQHNYQILDGEQDLQFR